MTIHLLVEGPSERAFLEPWSRRLLKGYPVKVHPHQGKGALPTNLGAPPDPKRRGLLDQLPAKLRGFANAMTSANDGVVIMVDADADDVATLERSIVEAARTVAPQLGVIVQVAVEETEAFYLGDLKALARAFHAANLELANAYEPDSICGTWELFGRIIGDGGGNKVAWAETMGPLVTTVPGRSRSPSFRSLLRGLLGLLPARPAAKKKRAWRHASRPSKRK